MEAATMTLEQAVERYSAILFKYCCGVLCNYHDAQDAVQEVFIKVFAKQAVYRHDTNFGGWLYRVAYNTCVSMLRKKRFKPLGRGAVPSAQAYDATDPYENHFISETLLDALRTLAPRERALLFSRALDGSDYSQLEAVYGASAAALRKRYERARKKLQEYLKISGLERSYS